MRAASVTETSRSGGAYLDYQDGASVNGPTSSYPSTTSSLPPSKSSYPTTASAALPTPTSSHSTPVPISSTLPTTVPSDLIPPSATWVPSTTIPTLLHPSTWTETSNAGPAPFTSLLSYRLPSSNAEVTWEARKHRRQVEQLCVSNLPASVEAKRAERTRPWWNRLHLIHLKRWSWWAVLWYNVGSHALVYAAICLFIPYFNTDTGIYQANTGWSSNVLAAVFWLTGIVFEIMAAWSVRPVGKWYQVPKPLLKRNQRKVDPRVYDCAYVEDPRSAWRMGAFGQRLEGWILTARLLGVLCFVIATVSYSGAFSLTHGQRVGLVSVVGILCGSCLTIANYLSLAECCHQWLPVKRVGRSSIHYLDWWANVLAVLASLAMLAYYIELTVQPDLLDQRQGPAYPYIVMACLFTVSDWLQAIEQGEHFHYERATPAQPVAAAPMNAFAATAPAPAPASVPPPYTRPLKVVDDNSAGEHRLSIQSPRAAVQPEAMV